LEEKIGAVAGFLSPRVGRGVAEVEAELRRVLEELKADPRNAVRHGFARLVYFPPSSEEELGAGAVKVR